MFLDVTTLAQNITDITVTYTAQQISDAITDKVLWAFIDFIIGLSIAGGLTATKVEELKAAAILIMSLFGTLSAIEFLRAILTALTSTIV